MELDLSFLGGFPWGPGGMFGVTGRGAAAVNSPLLPPPDSVLPAYPLGLLGSMGV